MKTHLTIDAQPKKKNKRRRNIKIASTERNPNGAKRLCRRGKRNRFFSLSSFFVRSLNYLLFRIYIFIHFRLFPSAFGVASQGRNTWRDDGNETNMS